MHLLPIPPVTPLLESLARVLREGIPQIPALTPAMPWLPVERCPAGHPFFPQGLTLVDFMQAGKVLTPACEILCDEQAVTMTENDGRLWKVPVEIDLLWDRDIWNAPEGEQLQAILKMLLTNAITLPDNTVQTAQARLSTAGLHVWGSRDADNFTGQDFAKLTALEGHPLLSFRFTVICSGIRQP